MNQVAHTISPDDPDSLAELISVLRGADMPALVGPDGTRYPLRRDVFEVLLDTAESFGRAHV